MSYIDDTGYHRTGKADRLASLQASVRAIFGANIDLGPDTPDGQLLDGFAGYIDEIDQLVEAAYNARSPSQATGAALSRLVRLNGVARKSEAFATAILTLTGTNGTFVPKGSLVASSVDGSVVFATDEDVTIAGSTAVSATAKVSGTLADTAIAAHTLTVVLTVISGWNSSDNADDATNGAPGETDAQLRTRRALSVAMPSQGIVDGLEAHLLQILDVQDAVVRENPEDTTQTLADGGTLAPHAIQVIVEGGADLDVAQAIYLRRASGCTMVGSQVVSVPNSQGVGLDVRFDRADHLPVYVVVHSASALATDVQDQIKAAIVALGNGALMLNGTPLPGSKIGRGVAVSDIYAAIMVLTVTALPGLIVAGIDLGTSPSPTGALISIAYNQIATWDSANVGFASP
jgi:uncharacterized phage protein gp47/JayE